MNATPDLIRTRWCACAISQRITDGRTNFDHSGAAMPDSLPVLKLQCVSSVAVLGRDLIRGLAAAAGPRPIGAVLALLGLPECPHCGSLADDLRGPHSQSPAYLPVWLSVGRPVNGYARAVEWPRCADVESGAIVRHA